MRWLAHAAVTVALLACGLLAYDVLRPGGGADPAWMLDTPGDLGPEASRDGRDGRDTAHGDTRRGDMVLGDPAQAEIPPAMADLLGRLARLEEEVAALPTPDGSGAATGGRPTPVSREDGGPRSPAAFDPDRLQAFRLALEEVERQQRQEQLGRSIRGQVASLGLTLRPEQEQRVVEETSRLWRTQAELWRTMGPVAAVDSRMQEAQAALERLRDAWARAIRDELPTVDAEKVIAHFGRGVQGIGSAARFGPETRGPSARAGGGTR